MTTKYHYVIVHVTNEHPTRYVEYSLTYHLFFRTWSIVYIFSKEQEVLEAGSASIFR